MKKILLTVVALAICSLCLWSALAEPMEDSRMFHNGTIQNACSMELKLTNYGTLGASDNFSNLIFPSYSGINYLYIGSLWIGAKKYRRNAAGELLFWVAQNPSADSSQVITQNDPLWNSNLKVVVDTLTSCGFDGDRNLFELLPAYNPFAGANSSIQDLYTQYNPHDKVLKSILSHPMPREFAYPDPQGNYCFTYPQDITGDEPAIETCSAFYYDFCPFGTLGERDWGTYSNTNNHVPLQIAVEQKSYAWPLQNRDKMIIFKYTLINASEIDTLYDIAIALYMDCDVGPVSLGSQAATDDLSGYVMGPGYEFAYSRDADFDGGITPGFVASKLYVPVAELNRDCYYWRVGDGPDDFTPLSMNYTFRQTANEKYWLMTGRNPNPGFGSEFLRLRGGPTGDVTEYIQPTANDTRFLYSFFGQVPGGNGSTVQPWHLGPMQSVTFYQAVFADYSLDGLKAQSLTIEDFIDSGFAIGSTSGLTSMPYITYLDQTSQGIVDVMWFSYTNPDHFELMYKLADAPATDWVSITLPGEQRSGSIGNLENLQFYKFKVASIYNPGPDEVYLESQTIQFLIDDYNPNDDNVIIPILLSSYPNPFGSKTGTTIRFDPKADHIASMEIYNARGQRVKSFTQEELRQGQVVWTGIDNRGKALANGIYLCVLKTRNSTAVRKLLYLK